MRRIPRKWDDVGAVMVALTSVAEMGHMRPGDSPHQTLLIDRKSGAPSVIGLDLDGAVAEPNRVPRDVVYQPYIDRAIAVEGWRCSIQLHPLEEPAQLLCR